MTGHLSSEQLGRELRDGIRPILKTAAQDPRLGLLFMRRSGLHSALSNRHPQKTAGTSLARFRCRKSQWLRAGLFDPGCTGCLAWHCELCRDRLPGRAWSREPLANTSVDADWHGIESYRGCSARRKVDMGRMQEVPRVLAVVPSGRGGDMDSSPDRYSGNKSGSSAALGTRACLSRLAQRSNAALKRSILTCGKAAFSAGWRSSPASPAC